MSISKYIIASYRTGSSVICNPPVTDTDEDWALLVVDRKSTQATLLSEGWKVCGTAYENDGRFTAFRKGNKNIMVMDDADHYRQWVRATDAATQLNLLDKGQRVALFEAVKAEVMLVRGDYVD